jgi:hypothetical protein
MAFFGTLIVWVAAEFPAKRELLGGDLRQCRLEPLPMRLIPTSSTTEPSVGMRTEQLSKAG